IAAPPGQVRQCSVYFHYRPGQRPTSNSERPLTALAARRSPLASEAIIDVEGLVKQFGAVVAVDGISFTVQRGEIFGILRPNGAGKTTTLEIIETLQKPTTGRVLVDGIDVVRDAWAVKSRIGVQLQSAGFYPE